MGTSGVEHPPRTEAADSEIVLFGKRLLGRLEAIIEEETGGLDGPSIVQLTAQERFPYRLTKIPYKSGTLRASFLSFDRGTTFPSDFNFKQFGYSFEAIEQTGRMSIEPYFHIVMYDNGQYVIKLSLNDDNAMLVHSFDESIASLDDLISKFDNSFVQDVLLRVGLGGRLTLDRTLLTDGDELGFPTTSAS